MTKQRGVRRDGALAEGRLPAGVPVWPLDLCRDGLDHAVEGLGPLPGKARALLLGLLGSRTVRAFEPKETRDDTLAIAELPAAGRFCPVVDRTHDLAAAPEADHYLEQGHTQGKIVVTI